MQTLKEKLLSGEKETILSELKKIVNKEEKYYFQEINPKFCKLLDAIDGILSDDFPTKLKICFPFIKRYIKTTLPNMMKSIMSEEPYWDKIEIDDKNSYTRLAKSLNSLLKKHVYTFNDIFNIIDSENRDLLTFGTTVTKDGWETEIKTKKIKKLKNVVINEDSEELEAESEEIEIEEIEELIKDNLKIKNIDIRNIRFDSTATEIDELEYIYEHIYSKVDSLKEMFENTDEVLDKYIKSKSDSEKEFSVNSAEESEREKDNVDNRDMQLATNCHVIEFYIYDRVFYLLCEGNGEQIDIIDLLSPKNSNPADKYENPYNHGEFPYSIYFYNKNKGSLYGEGLAEELYKIWLITTFVFNYFLDKLFEETNAPIAYNSNGAVDSTELLSVLTGEGRFVASDGDPRGMFMPIKLQRQLGILFQVWQNFEGQMQTQSATTNFERGGSQVQSYTETLGGIKEILKKSFESAAYSIKINEGQRKKHLYRCLSNIFQFQKDKVFVKIEDVNGIEYVEFRREFDNSQIEPKDIVLEINDVKKAVNLDLSNGVSELNDNSKFFVLDEIMKLKLNIDFNFNIGEEEYKFQQAQLGLNIGMSLASAGIPVDIIKLVKKFFKQLGLDDIIKDDDSEMEIIESENDRFYDQYLDYLTLLKEGKIDDKRFMLLCANAINPPKPDENDMLHLAEHKKLQETKLKSYPDAFLPHMLIHQQYYDAKMKATQELQRMRQQQQSGGQDGRTIVGKQNRNGQEVQEDRMPPDTSENTNDNMQNVNAGGGNTNV